MICYNLQQSRNAIYIYKLILKLPCFLDKDGGVFANIDQGEMNMSFADIFKKSFLEKFENQQLTTTSIVIVLGMAIILGLFIYFVYRMNSKGGFYNRGFNKSLATLPVITAAILLAMGSNLTVSLGMVGALSIVRFRNAIKDTADLTYLFWSISLGIIVGVGLFELAILLSFAIAVLVSLLDLIPTFRSPCLLVVSAENKDIESQLLTVTNEYAKIVKIRSRNISSSGVEWILEMKTRDESGLVKSVSQIEHVTFVHLMTHDGDVRF